MKIIKNIDICIEEKPLQLGLTKRALSFLDSNTANVYIGLEVYFSCFVKKIVVSLKEKPERDIYSAYKNLYIYFRPVQSKSCNIHDLIGKNSPMLIDFPVKKRKAIIPSTVKLDFVNNKWRGDFTWKRSRKEKNYY